MDIKEPTMKTLVIAVPEALMDDANQLFLVMGQSAADVNSFRDFNFERMVGEETDDLVQERYCIRSTRVSDDWLAKLNGTLSAPDFAPDADLTAATRARDAIDYTIAVAPDKIAARLELPVPDALDEMEAGELA